MGVSMSTFRNTVGFLLGGKTGTKINTVHLKTGEKLQKNENL